MDENKNDKYYLERMLEIINYIEMYIKNISDLDLKIRANDQNSDGVMYKFIQLREEAKNLSQDILDNNDVLKRNISSLIGFRNRITHDYQNVSYTFLDEIIEHDLPTLKEEIKKLINR